MTEPSYDLGVLVVHGIGDQRSGGTLEEFDALVDCVTRWVPGGVVSDERHEQAGTTPAHAMIELADVGGEPLRALVVEGHWADTVEEPSTWTLLKWLASVVPFVVPRVLDGQIRRSSTRIDKHRRENNLLRLVGVGALRLMLNVVTVVATLLVLGALFALWLLGLPRAGFDEVTRRRRGDDEHDPLWVPVAGAIVLGAVLGLSLFAFMSGGPVTWTGAAVTLAAAVIVAIGLPRILNSLIARYIGDCYALLRRKDLRKAMVARIAHCLQWLEQHAGTARVVVIAHSQGAEVVRLVLVRRKPGIDGLVTLGSGIEKLGAVRKLRAHPWRSVGILAMRATSAALVLLAVAALGSWPWPALSPWLALPALLAAPLLLSLARRALQHRVWEDYSPAMLGVTEEQTGRWADFYAAPDPVPEGDLPIAGWGTSQAIDNERVFLLDHIRYWHNVQAFLAPVALELAAMADREPGNALHDSVRQGAAARKTALRVRVRLRVAIVTALAVALAGVLTGCPAAIAIAIAAAAIAFAMLRARAGDARRLALAWSPCPPRD